MTEEEYVPTEMTAEEKAWFDADENETGNKKEEFDVEAGMKELSDKMDSLIEMMAQQPQKAEPQQQSGGIMESLQSLIGSP